MLLSLKLSSIIKEKLNPQRTVLAKKLNAVEGILREYKTYQNDPDYLEGNFARLCYRYVKKFKQGESLDSLLTDAINDEYTTASSFFD